MCGATWPKDTYFSFLGLPGSQRFPRADEVWFGQILYTDGGRVSDMNWRAVLGQVS
jgi:hypothetical protein